MADMVTAANDLVGAGRTAEAMELLERACAQADMSALFELAVWHLTGKTGKRDLPAALALLRRAGAAGHVGAAMMAIAMTANGSAGAPDWPMAMALLNDLARRDSDAAHQLRLLESMKLNGGTGERASLPPVRTLSTEPRVDVVDRFLSAEECAHLAYVGNGLLAPATVVNPTTGLLIEHPIRTSHAGAIGPLREDLVARAINIRIAQVSQTEVGHGEPLMILRYTPGQQYRLHSDAIPGAPNQRRRTVLIYLNDDYVGGETAFPDLDLRVRGRTGDALVFDNVDAGGRPHPLAKHAGLPVTSGIKWLATRWIRARRFDPWNPV